MSVKNPMMRKTKTCVSANIYVFYQHKLNFIHSAAFIVSEEEIQQEEEMQQEDNETRHLPHFDIDDAIGLDDLGTLYRRYMASRRKSSSSSLNRNDLPPHPTNQDPHMFIVRCNVRS
jgi:hypothetical protein